MTEYYKDDRVDDFEVPREAKYKIEKGEVWTLGNHRLMCGDATIKEVRRFYG